MVPVSLTYWGSSHCLTNATYYRIWKMYFIVRKKLESFAEDPILSLVFQLSHPFNNPGMYSQNSAHSEATVVSLKMMYLLAPALDHIPALYWHERESSQELETRGRNKRMFYYKQRLPAALLHTTGHLWLEMVAGFLCIVLHCQHSHWPLQIGEGELRLPLSTPCLNCPGQQCFARARQRRAWRIFTCLTREWLTRSIYSLLTLSFGKIQT